MNRKTLPNLEIASRCRKGLVVLFFIPLGALSPAAELKGLWEFADAANLAKATFGNDLILGGAHTHHATLSDDAATPLSGAITTAGGTTSFLKALHGIAPNGGGTFVNQYSIMVDLFSPAGSRGNYRAIFQTAATPTTNDADYFINPTGDTLGTSAWGYSSSGINETKWTRLVITVDLTQAGGASTPKYRTYLDGSLFHAHTGTADGALNGRFSLFPVGHASHGIHFFADNTAAENPPMNIGTLAIYDGVLTPAEVAALGGAGNPVPTPDPGEPPSLAAGPAGPASVTTGFYNNFSFAATDPEGAQVQVQVDWGDGTLSAWSALAGSGTPIALAKTYHLAGTHELRARARDQLGGTSAWVAIQTVTATTPPGVPDGLAGLWEFDDPGNPGLATFGNNLTVVGATPAHAATLTDGAASPATLQGVITTVQGAANRLLANHGLGGNGGGSKTNQYTLLFDVLLPAAGQWRSFYQTNPANSTDAQFFVRNSDSTLGRVAITYSRTPLEPNRWARLAISVRLGSGGQFTSYLDGMPFHSHTVPATDGEFALDPAQLLLFADNDGENHPLAIGMAALFAKALTESEIGALGGPGLAVITDPSNQPPAIVQQSAGSSAVTTGTTENYVFTATDPDGDPVQVQADWGDGTVSSWTGLGPAGIAQSRAHSWSAPGTFLLRARARDSQGGVSSWVELQSVQVTGPAVVTFLTPPYLQNMATDRMVVMWETAENIQLDLQHGLPGGGGARVIGERVASGGGTYFHRAVITGLQPGASYSYQVLSGNDPVTQPATFRTAPAGSVDFKFGALGDVQTTNRGVWDADPWEPAKTMLQHMADRGVAFGLGVGDHAQDGNSYASTKNSHLDRFATVLGTKVPFYIAWGNHDGNSPSHPLRLAADMPSRFRPGLSPGHGNYSFTYSNVFFVCFDYFYYNNEFTNGWLEAELASPAAQNARFRIVAVHVPPYCERWINGNATLRSQLVPLMEQYGVDLCLSGHMHGYERGRINGVQYVVTGCGSYLDFPETLVANWSATTDDGLWLGGHNSVPGQYARQSANGVLGPPEPIVGGLFHGYSEITVRGGYMRLDQHGFNADGSYIGILDTIEFGGPDPGPDTDGDGMRDPWELANGLDPNIATGVNGPDGDLDGDGQTNYQEMLAGTAANDPTSVFRAQVAAVNPGEMLLVWSSVPGKRYRIQTSEDLTQWTPLHDGNGSALVIDASPGTTTSHAVPTAGQARRFARVEVVAD